MLRGQRRGEKKKKKEKEGSARVKRGGVLQTGRRALTDNMERAVKSKSTLEETTKNSLSNGKLCPPPFYSITTKRASISTMRL